MYNTLSAPGIGAAVNFSYFPVNHWAPDGSFYCGAGTDCAANHLDSCLAHTYCWHGACSQATQLAVSEVLQCIEGPHANMEGSVPPSHRAPCMAKAGLLEAPVDACAANKPLLNGLLMSLNASKAEMMKQLGANAGYFPHVSVDGAYLGNFTWTRLTRHVCGVIAARPAATRPPMPAACAWMPFTVGAVLQGTQLTPQSARAAGGFAAQVGGAVNKAVSNATLPVRFTTTTDYDIDVGALQEASTKLISATAAAGGAVQLEWQVDALAAFQAQLAGSVPTKDFAAYLAAALSGAPGFPGKVTAANVVKSWVVQA